ncbi:hypothetical protein [Streptomyces sp. NPDC093261]|uniref:hypothetical protein n=1 Tax=Streptomyces sp. NPDC093261 TaxID=3366037 RepID=UPI00381DE933
MLRRPRTFSEVRSAFSALGKLRASAVRVPWSTYAAPSSAHARASRGRVRRQARRSATSAVSSGSVAGTPAPAAARATVPGAGTARSCPDSGTAGAPQRTALLTTEPSSTRRSAGKRRDRPASRWAISMPHTMRLYEDHTSTAELRAERFHTDGPTSLEAPGVRRPAPAPVGVRHRRPAPAARPGGWEAPRTGFPPPRPSATL